VFVHNLKIGKENNAKTTLINTLQKLMRDCLWSRKSFLSLQSNISVGIMNRKLKAKDEILKTHIAG
jgi:hypothetical protein